jgi:hypothetical protein
MAITAIIKACRPDLLEHHDTSKGISSIDTVPSSDHMAR